MKRQRKILCLLAALVCVCCLLASCGKSNGSANDSAPGTAGESGFKSEIVSENRKIVVRADYAIETMTFDETVRQIETVTAQAGGYISESSVYPARDGGSGHAYLTIRIPSTDADGFMTALSGVGNVTSANVTKTDVTLTYDDVSARVAVLRAEQEKLTEMIGLLDASNPENAAALLKIRQQYSEVTQELSSYERQLRTLENEVSYATFTVRLSDVKSYSDEGDHFIVRFGRSFGKSFVSFAKVLGHILIALVYLLPYLLIVAVIVAIVIVVTRKNRNKRKKTQNAVPGTPESVRFGAPSADAASGSDPVPATDGTAPVDGASAGSDAPVDTTPQEGENK